MLMSSDICVSCFGRFYQLIPKTQGGQATNSQENIVIRFETPECMCCMYVCMCRVVVI